MHSSMARSWLTVRLRSLTHPLGEMIARKMGQSNALITGESPRCLGTSHGEQETVAKYLPWRALGDVRRQTITRSMVHEIVVALRSGERSRASILLSELVHAGENLKSWDFIYILKYCARYADALFAMETWILMDQKKITLHARCYFLTIRALCKGGYVEEAFNIVSTVEENSVMTPTLPIYNNLLQACIQTNDMYYVNECLLRMEYQAVGKDEITYALLLKLAVLQKDLQAVKDIWEECFEKCSLSIILLREFILSFTMLKDLESAYVALQKIVAVALQGKFRFVRSAEGNWLQLGLDIPIPFTWDSYEKYNLIHTRSRDAYRKEEESNKIMYQVSSGMEVKEVQTTRFKLWQNCCVGLLKILRWSFNDVMHACARKKNVMMAEQLLLQMENIGLEPSSSTYDSFLRVLVSEKSLKDGLEVLKVMQQKKLKPGESTLAVMSATCSRARELDLAEMFLDQIPNCRYAYPYNYFFQACDATDQPERAIRCLSKMKSLNVQPDIGTYEVLFSLFVNVNSPYEESSKLSQDHAAKRIHAIEKDMKKHGIEQSQVSMQNMLKGLGREGMMAELHPYLHMAENQFAHINSYAKTCIFECVLHPLVEAKETQAAISIFKRMMRSFRPNAVIFTIMIDCCSVIECHRSACGLAAMMIRCGFLFNVITYTCLVKVFSGLGDFDEAFKLLELARTDGIEPNVQMYNTIIRGAQTKERIDVIELIVGEMLREKIQPDTSTCTRVFSAYIYSGYHSTGMEALQVLSMRMISEEDEVLQQAKLRFENLIFDEDLTTEWQMLRGFRISPTLSMALLQLRWCAIFGYPISWSPNQSSWTKRLKLSHHASRQARSFIQI